MLSPDAWSRGYLLSFELEETLQGSFSLSSLFSSLSPPTFSLKLLSYISACIQSLNKSVLPRLLSISYILNCSNSCQHHSCLYPNQSSCRLVRWPSVTVLLLNPLLTPKLSLIGLIVQIPYSYLPFLSHFSLAWQVYLERPLSSRVARSRAHQV